MSDWFDDAGNGSAVEVPALLSDQVVDLVAHIVSHGALVSIGRTSDGGALGVTLTMDGKWRREYFRDAEPLVEWLSEGAKAVQLAAEDLAASTARRSRTRGRQRGL